MKLHLQSVSGELLLAIGGACLFFTFGVWLLFSSVMQAQQAQALELQNRTYFEIGQYYFNHDEDPEGPYDIQKARHYFELEIAARPSENKYVYYQLGRIDFIEGKFDAALENFNTQIRLFGDSVPNVYYMIGLTYGYQARVGGNQDDWVRAEEAFTHFITFAPQAPWSRVDLAWIYFAQGKYESMLPVLEEGLEYEPDNAWLLNMYGLAVMNTRDADAALPYLQRAKEAAALLSVQDWGRSYPGNDPQAWSQGLAEFRAIIQKNIDIASQ